MTRIILKTFAFSFLILSILSACDSDRSHECGGWDNVIYCLKRDNAGNVIDSHSTMHCKQDIPPCECYNNQNQDIRGDFEKFKTHGCSKYGDGNGELTVEQPYNSECGTSFTDVCVENQSNPAYFDRSEGNYDVRYRPIYVKFAIGDFKLGLFDYSVVLEDEVNKTIVSEVKISMDEMDEEKIRDFYTLSNGHTSGTVKLDMSRLPPHSINPYIRLYKKGKGEDASLSEIAFRSINVITKTPFLFADSRILKLVTCSSSTYDVRKLETTTGDDYVASLNRVFGFGASNIRFDLGHKEIGKDLIDDEGNVILDRNDCSVMSGQGYADITGGLNIWQKEAYIQSFGKDKQVATTGAFAIESWFLNIYSIDSRGYHKDFTKEKALELITESPFGHPQGITSYYEDPEDKQQSLAILIFRNDLKLHEIFGNNFTPALSNGSALATFLHEVGHSWSDKAWDDSYGSVGNDCKQHTAFCSGFNKEKCLWRTACVTDAEEQKKYLEQKAKFPVFCERHQNIFMNGFTMKN